VKTGIVWLRRDLRLDDNVALHEASRECDRICLAFVVNPPLLRDPRIGVPLVSSFAAALSALRAALLSRGSDLALLRGDFARELLSLAREIGADCVYFNDDYEPEARRRDDAVERELARAGLKTRRFTDHVYYGFTEVVQANGDPYRMFSPYRRRWLESRGAASREPRPSERSSRSRLMPARDVPQRCDMPILAAFGLSEGAALPVVSEPAARERLAEFLGAAPFRYAERRDFPAIDGTSRLSAQLRAGTIGIRTCVEAGCARGAEPDGGQAERWVDQLIWRDFFQQILVHFPFVEVRPFQPRTERVPWRWSRAEFEAWCAGRTGYPIVDAAMRQLNETGWMHNRLRMLAASFLTKHLLIDWREGERYFARTLADADLAQNNGGWQWAASTGTDAVPYFRFFNPTTQAKRFDPEGEFVRRYVPELADVPTACIHEPWRADVAPLGYPAPIVEHHFARARTLDAFAACR
jgi:deoxyribodipyrimidine photo-lyase